MKALFVPFGASLAHVSRCLAVAEAWREQGHTALFAVGAEQTKWVQSIGFETYAVPEVPGKVLHADRTLGWVTREYIHRNVQDERRILTDVQPDVVVFDFRFTTALSARLAGIPSVSILHGNLLHLALNPCETVQRQFGDAKHARGIAALRLKAMRRLSSVVFPLFMRSVVRPVNEIRKRHGLQPVNSPFELLLGDETIAADIPSLLPPELPPHCSVTGPLMWSGWANPEPWLDELSQRPLIYVTMGSTVDVQVILVKVIDALRDAPYNIVVSTGEQALPNDLRWPSHIHVFPSVSGEAVMRRSIAVVFHGGHGTLMQALKAGTPSLMLPANPDQILVAQQVQALGVGHILRHTNGPPIGNKVFDKITSSQIRYAVDKLVADQQCAQACKMIAQDIERYDSAAVSVEILKRMATRQSDQIPGSGYG
ncbi:MAG: hypothetical protein JXA21_19240 [Anaerolineae bacterium]|nr:hypothetical protein [Anaerolineae bacterium]